MCKLRVSGRDTDLSSHAVAKPSPVGPGPDSTSPVGRLWDSTSPFIIGVTLLHRAVPRMQDSVPKAPTQGWALVGAQGRKARKQGSPEAGKGALRLG